MVRSATGTGSYTATAGTYTKPTVPSVTQTPNPVNRGQTFTLTGSSTTSSNVYYTGKWNDGTADSRDPTSGTKPPSSSYSLSHSFGADGDFQVNVSATDANGLSNWALPNVIVRDPPSGATDPATNVEAHSATLNGNVGSLGGYSNVQVWFQYGLDTNYGSNTPAQTRTTGPASASITGLASGTTYHYRIAIQNPLGTFTGGDQEFKTPNNAPGAPSISQSATVTSRNEAFYVTGSATDQNGDNIRYNISWGDGTWNLYPADGSSVPSGTPYNVSHAHTSYGVKTITVTVRDVSGSPVDVSNWATHTVADPPAGSTSAPTTVGRTGATLEGTVTDIGGDSAGVQAWFEYGPSGSFPWATSKVVRTTTGAVSIPVGWLAEGSTYNYRLVLQNVRATTTTTALNFSTNARPVLTAAEPFTPYALEGGKFSFVLAYTDQQNEAPASGYPRVVIDNTIVLPMSKTNAGDGTYTDGVLYAATWTSTSGAHMYKYETRDAVPETLTTNGLYAQLRVNRTIEFRDPIQHAPGTTGQPPAGWYTDTLAPGSQCWGGTDSPFWHTVNTPTSGLVQNAPDRTVKDGPSVSLWFGTDSGPGAGTYSNGQSRACGRVVSPEISLAGDPSPSLRFWSYFETEDDGDDNDLKRVYVQDALGLQTLLLTLSKPTHGSKGWMPVATSLKPFAGKEIRLVFEFDSRDGLNNANAGWFINELVVGHDTDLDGIPDAAEAVDVAAGRWTSADSGFVQSPSSKARLGGIQSSYAISAQSEVTISSPTTTTITLNNSRWSTVIYNQGTLGAGTQAPVSLGGGVQLIRTNLSLAGLDLRTLDVADNFTLTVSSTSSLAYMKQWSIRLQGRTAFNAADGDRDGVADGGEGFRLGTLPFVLDPDNDLITDREDQRPYTPDSPPNITRIRATGGNWQTSVSFDTTARYGVKDVKVLLQGTDGSSRLLIPKRIGPNSWQVDLPVAPTSLRIGANDTYNSYTEVTLPYAGGSTTPTGVSVRLGAWTGGSLLNQRSTMSAGIVVTAAEAIFIALVVGLMALAHIIAREGSNSNGESNPKVLDEVVLPSSAVGPAWSIEPGKLGCVRSVSLLYGYGGVAADAAHRGAYGITRDYPDYANAQQVYNTIDTAMATPSNRFVIQDTPHTGAIIAYNTNKGVWQKWTVSLDPVTCTGEVVREQRQKWDEDFRNLMVAVITIAGAGSLVMLSTLIRGNWEDWRDERTDRVRLMDAKNNHTIAYEFGTYFTDDLLSGANQRYWHSQNPDRDMGSTAQQMMWFAWRKASVMANVQPAWYWQSRTSTASTTDFTLKGNNAIDIFPGGSPPAYKDQMAGTQAVEVDIYGALRSSEQAICTLRGVDGTPRNAFLPTGWVDIVAQDIVKVHMTIELAASPSEFYGGPC